MRTTIELKDEHRAKLLELAARRGEKGFSDVLGEAIEAYLETLSSNQARRQAAIELRGSLGEADVRGLREAARSLRESWR